MTRFGSMMARKFSARVRRSSALRLVAHAGGAFDFRQNHNFMGIWSRYSRRCSACLPALLLLTSACAFDRPIQPLRLDGFPGAEVEPGLFPLRDGMAWTFEDRIDPDAPPLQLRVVKEHRRYFLVGTKQEEQLEIAHVDGYLEVRQGERVVDRPLRYPGQAGDTWLVNQALVTIFGYDDVDVMGEEKRALVVAVDRRQMRDLAWFVKGMGWVRLRTERRGKVIRDARLTAYEPGRMN